MVLIRCLTVLLLAASWAFESAAELNSCLGPDIKERIRKKVANSIPLANCKHSYEIASQTCSQLIRWNSLDIRDLTLVKGMQEQRLIGCERRIRTAKENCADDPTVLSVLNAEFNDVVRCADASIAEVNGRKMKQSEYSRMPASSSDDYNPDDSVTDGELSNSPPSVADQPADH